MANEKNEETKTEGAQAPAQEQPKVIMSPDQLVGALLNAIDKAPLTGQERRDAMAGVQAFQGLLGEKMNEAMAAQKNAGKGKSSDSLKKSAAAGKKAAAKARKKKAAAKKK